MKKSPKLAGEDWTSLAKRLEVSREAVRLWRKLPGAPLEPDFALWEAFKRDRGLGLEGGDELKKLKAEKLREEIESARLRNARLRGSAIPADEVRAYDTAYAAKLEAFLKVKLVLETPTRLNGKSIAESRVEMERVHDEIRTFLQAGVMKWEPEAA